MKDKNAKNRRQFLKNISLSALSLGILPLMSSGKSQASTETTLCDQTTLDFYGQGPFYTAGAPSLTGNQLADVAEPGTRMIISGRIYNLDCTQVIPSTVLDIWHANDAGAYDNTGFNLRGITTSNAAGFYQFETIQPGKYLNGASFRPSHIHFKITPPGFPEFITQLYFTGDTDIPGDAAASLTSGTYDATHRIIPLTMGAGGVLEGTWDIVIDGSGVTGVNDMHTNKGMVYTASPNPFSDRVKIRYGVFKPARVALQVYDLEGKLVANLEETSLRPDKYEAIWEPDAALPKGYYFIALKIDDLQVHYVKVLRQ